MPCSCKCGGARPNGAHLYPLRLLCDTPFQLRLLGQCRIKRVHSQLELLLQLRQVTQGTAVLSQSIGSSLRVDSLGIGLVGRVYCAAVSAIVQRLRCATGMPQWVLVQHTSWRSCSASRCVCRCRTICSSASAASYRPTCKRTGSRADSRQIAPISIGSASGVGIGEFARLLVSPS